MQMFITIILLVVGFVLLIKGADFFVDGSSSLAREFHIPGLVIGMTIVAMGTSLPELSVSVTSSIAGHNQLAVSNVIGSNIFNLMVVLGASAVFSTLSVSKSVIKKDLPFSIFAALLIVLIGLTTGKVNRIWGIVFLAFFAFFIWSMIHRTMTSRKTAAEKAEDEELDQDFRIMPLWLTIIYIVGGIIAIKFGGDLVVDSSEKIARAMGVSETLIGLTIVACGTSLPELATSIVAAKKNELDMAVGNAVGSNIFNLLAILGVAAVITPVAISIENIIDAVVLIVFSFVVWLFCFKSKAIKKPAGFAMIAMYVSYLVYICIRK
ncbi:MAG: sodium:calcium antiporter [Lachnospiraceae bacterium]|uniref:Calcium/sodium antiporter n=1 Tax=Candidatus Weimeria bifida TaxID=2599074 RepID=A0A6N7J1Z4_9FIRM|nr:calcium/sodium antiporter [Candidatus Weimeria bifida]RRF96881.1 MAG: sodium:calcium antiporter [Lachnospiraceae bacterium]